MTRSSSGWRITDHVLTAVVVVAVVGWSILYAVLGPLLLRPVSSCAGPDLRCTEVVDLGVGIASWGPSVVGVVVLLAVARCVRRDRATVPVALLGVLVIVALQTIGLALVPLGVVSR